MKAKRIVVTMMVALAYCGCAAAQSSIDRIVDELETKGVDVSKVVKRDPKTKQIYSEVKSLTFYSKDGKYAKRLIEAFRQEAVNAAEEIVKERGNSYLLIFKDGKKKATYSLRITESKTSGKDPKVSVSIISRDSSVSDGLLPWGGVFDKSFKESVEELNAQLDVELSKNRGM